MSFENVKYLTKFANVVRNILLYYLHIDFPISEYFGVNRNNETGWVGKITNGFNNILSYFSLNKNSVNNVTYVRKMDPNISVDNLYKHKNNFNRFKNELAKNNNNPSNGKNINDIVSDNLLIVSETAQYGADFDNYYVDFLMNLFNEFNLFC